jgi:hypothetical protein
MVLPDGILFAFHRFDATWRQTMRSNPDNPYEIRAKRFLVGGPALGSQSHANAVVWLPE